MASPVVQKIQFRLDDKDLKQSARGLRNVDKETTRTRKGIRGLQDRWRRMGAAGKVAIAALVAGLVSLARAGFRVLNESVRLAGIQQIADRKLAQAIRNTGAAVDEWLPKLKASASELQNMSNFADEATVTAQALLLSFREVAGPEGALILTKRLADTAAGLAKVNGETMDLNSVAALMGRAMTQGASALSRVGVSLTDTQKRAFDLATGIDRVNILAEILDDNFRDMAKTTADPFVMMSHAAGDAKEVIGSELRPELAALANDFRNLLQDNSTTEALKSTGQFVAGVLRLIVRTFSAINGVMLATRAGIQKTISLAIAGRVKLQEAVVAVKEFAGFDVSEDRKQIQFMRDLSASYRKFGEENERAARSAFKLVTAATDLAGMDALGSGGGGGAGGGGGGDDPVLPGGDFDEKKAKAEALRKKVEELAQSFQGLQQRGASVAELGVFSRLRAEAAQFEQTIRALRLEYDRGSISQEEFLARSEAASRGAMAALERLIMRFGGLKELPPEALELLQELFGELRAEISETGEDLDEHAEKLREQIDTLSELRRTLDGMDDLLSVFGDQADGLRTFLGGITDVVRALEDMKRVQAAIASGQLTGSAATLGQIGAGIGIAGAAVGIIGSFVEASRAQKEEMRRLAEALRDNARAIRQQMAAAFQEGQIGAGVSQADIDRAAAILERLRGTGLTGGDRQDLFAELESLGIPGLQDIGQLYDSIRELVRSNKSAEFMLDALDIDIGQLISKLLTGDGDARGLLEQFGVDLSGLGIENLVDFIDRLGESLGTFSSDVQGAVDKIRLLTDLAGLEGTDALRAFIDMLLSTVEDIPPGIQAMLDEASKLDLSTEAGKARLNELIAQVATAVASGGFDFGGLSPDEVRQILDTLQGLADGVPIVAAGSEEDPFSSTFQVQRVLTEVQANAVILALDSILFWTRRSSEHLEMIAGAIVPGALSGAIGRTLASRNVTSLSGQIAQARTITIQVGDITVTRPYTSGEDDLRATMAAMEAAIRRKGYKAFRG